MLRQSLTRWRCLCATTLTSQALKHSKYCNSDHKGLLRVNLTKTTPQCFSQLMKIQIQITFRPSVDKIEKPFFPALTTSLSINLNSFNRIIHKIFELLEHGYSLRPTLFEVSKILGTLGLAGYQVRVYVTLIFALCGTEAVTPAAFHLPHHKNLIHIQHFCLALKQERGLLQIHF